jgi:uncharacterized membrane protein
MAGLAVPLLIYLYRRRHRLSPAATGLWIALAATILVPFLPGMKSAYPPTRMLLVLAIAASAADDESWGVKAVKAVHIIFGALWVTTIGARSWELYKRLAYGYDLAHVLNLVSNTTHGRFLHSDYTGASILSHHMFLSLALLAPLHEFIRSPFLPQLAQILLLAAAVGLVTSAAARTYGAASGASAFFVFLMHPAFQGQILHECDPGTIGLFGVALALFGRAWERETVFWCGAALAVISKEHFALAAMIAGLVMMRGGAEAKNGRRLAALGGATLVVFLVCTVLLAGPFGLMTQLRVRFGGDGIPVIGPLLEALSPGKLGYLAHMLLPTGGLALAAWPLLLPALPETILNMTSRFPMHHVATHYNALSLPFLAFATAAAVGNLGKKSASTARSAARFVTACAFGAAFVSQISPLSHTGAFYDVFVTPRDGEPRRLDALVARLPAGTVGVRGNHRLLIYFPDREPAIDLPYIDTTRLMESRDLLIYDHYDGPAPDGRALIDSEGEVRVYAR